MKQILLLMCCMGVFIISSCLVSKPDASSTSAPDYNQRSRIDNPHYCTQTSPIGYAAIGIGTIGGAYLGYQMHGGMVQQNGEVRDPIRPANAALGALTGFAATNLTLYLMGKNKKTSSVEANQWLQRANPRYIVYEKYSDNAFSAIPRQAENNFTVRTLADTKGFYRTFPGSPRRDVIFQNSIDKLSRSEIPELIKIQPDNRYVADAQLKYYEASANITELLEALQRFPGVNYPVEKRAAEMVASLDDVEIFRSKFGVGSAYGDYIFEKVYPALSLYDLHTLIGYYPKAKKVKDAKRLAVEKCTSLDDISAIKGFQDDLGSEVEVKGASLVLGKQSEAPRRFEQFLKIFPSSSRVHKADDNLYLGGWDSKYARPEGYGVRKYKFSQRVEVGNFKKGKLDDENGYSFDGQYVLTGRFQDGEVNGYGSETYLPDGQTYVGMFRNGEYSGQGKLSGAGALSYLFEYGGNGKNPWYEGQWANGEPNGKGRLEIENGDVWYEGEFKNGKFDGLGELRAAGVRFKGIWQKGRPNGRFTISKWTLMGLISSEATADLYSMADLKREGSKVEKDFATGGGSSEPTSGCNSSARIYIDVLGELEDKSKLSISAPSGVSVDSDENYETNDGATIHGRCIAGTYTFTYTWNIGQSDQNSYTGNITIDGRHQRYSIEISIFNKTHTVTAKN